MNFLQNTILFLLEVPYLIEVPFSVMLIFLLLYIIEVPYQNIFNHPPDKIIVQMSPPSAF